MPEDSPEGPMPKAKAYDNVEISLLLLWPTPDSFPKEEEEKKHYVSF